MSDLKPCPFCGGEAVKVDGYTVACAHGLCIGWTIRRASPHEWNTRTVQAQPVTADALYEAFVALGSSNYVEQDGDTFVTLDGCFNFEKLVAILSGTSHE